jgi:ribonuclease HI
MTLRDHIVSSEQGSKGGRTVAEVPRSRTVYTVVCDASKRTSHLTGELVAAIGVYIRDPAGDRIHEIAEIIHGWKTKNMVRLECRAMMRGLQIACELGLRRIVLMGDNHGAVNLMAQCLTARPENTKKVIRNCIDNTDTISVRLARKNEVSRAHDLANRASQLRLAKIAEKHSRRIVMEHKTDSKARGVEDGAVYLAYEHDLISDRDEVRLWSTSSSLVVDLSVAEWKALCAAIITQGKNILDLSTIGARTVIPVEPSEV